MVMEKQMFGKQISVISSRDSGTQRELWSPCPSECRPPPRTQTVFFIDISGDSDLPGPGPLSKFIQAVKEEVKRRTP